MAGVVCVVLLTLLLEGCARSSIHEPVTLTLLEEWTAKTINEGREQELRQFTKETGIQVKLLPSPESAWEKLALWRKFLRSGTSSPDVYGIDVIWSRILGEYLIDLKPYFASEISHDFPAIAARYSVDGKLIAMPYHADMGILLYRTDLLRQYGYSEPPRTWDELGLMAALDSGRRTSQGQQSVLGFCMARGRCRSVNLQRSGMAGR